MTSSRGSILVTGANGGLGCGIVSRIIATPELALYHGVYVVRDATQASALKSVLNKASSSHTYRIVSLDLAGLRDVRSTAQALRILVSEGTIPPFHALILAAGYNDMGQQSETKEGFDVSFVANYLGHWLLTLMLLQVMDQEHGRIVVVGSDSYDVTAPVHNIDGYYKEEKWRLFFREDNIDAIAHGTWSSNKDDFARHAGIRRYGVAKMCFIMMIGELQRRLDTDSRLKGISIAGIDPGVMGTGLVRRGNWITRVLMWSIIIPLIAPFLTWLRPNGGIRTIGKSAADVLQLGLDSDMDSRGRFYNGSELHPVVSEAANGQKRLMVWRDSVRYAKLVNEDTVLEDWN
ncbi:hypothetical protein S40288_06845 [Stachybotrys chartarum IBT 40288]|nr:hypothetical protein S40288_06845 [Stachybotrys chartarum IBT 40288]